MNAAADALASHAAELNQHDQHIISNINDYDNIARKVNLRPTDVRLAAVKASDRHKTLAKRPGPNTVKLSFK